MLPAYQELPPLGVGEAIALCNSLLQDLTLTIEGEVANYSVSRGKFVFFDLKDVGGESRLGCFMMIHQQTVPVEDGMRILIQGKPGLYAKSGQFRISVTKIQPRGEGSLKRAFEMLKAKLEVEGLFSPSRKRTLPRFPETIGIISSSEAAGYGDFMRIATERSCGIRFILAHVAVQGVAAEQEICAGFDYLNGHHAPDTIVLIRGGGSMEDLHAFNSEVVARAIVRSKAPVVVGVGHERDVTIADFCADVRAATPSNAAQLAVPDKVEVQKELVATLIQSSHGLHRRIQAMKHTLITTLKGMHVQIQHVIFDARATVQSYSATIEALAPVAVLKRGYSITRKADDSVVTTSKQLAPGERVTTYYAEGHSISEVTSIS